MCSSKQAVKKKGRGCQEGSPFRSTEHFLCWLGRKNGGGFFLSQVDFFGF